MSNKKLNKSSLIKKIDKIFSEYIRISNSDNDNSRNFNANLIKNFKDHIKSS
jgi:hypothetical protein